MIAAADPFELAAQAWETPTGVSRWATPYDLGKKLNPKLRQTPALKVISEHLMWAATTPNARLIISMPPQEGKSDLASRRFPLWLLERNQDLRIVIASYQEHIARRLSRFIRDDVTNHPDTLSFRVRPDLSSQSEWEIAGHEGGVYATGTGGALTSRSADVLIIDDPIKGREQADSETFRAKVWDWWLETAETRLSPGAPVIVILTRWHEDDLAARLIAEDAVLPEELRHGWRVLSIPAQCEDPATDPLGRAAGEFMESARGYRNWEKIKRGGARRWAALYQGHPAPSEGGIFKWDWIRPHRVRRTDVPHLERVVVALDTTGGGHDAAGIVVAGRGTDRRTYVLADHSRQATVGGQWRTAWMACLDYDADVLAYENNLVDPIMKRAAPATWTRMVAQARALDAAGVLLLDLDDADPDVLERRVQAAAAALTVGTGDDDISTADDPHAALAVQLRELVPYAARVLAAPVQGPARLTGVRATRGKTTRAEPVSAAYEGGGVSHVGVFPALEQELVTWQEGQDSPNRLDALVWAWSSLNGANAVGRVGSAAGRGRISTGPSTSTSGRV
jgi:hypothetical protein